MACTSRKGSFTHPDDLDLPPRRTSFQSITERYQLPSRLSFDRWRRNSKDATRLTSPVSQLRTGSATLSSNGQDPRQSVTIDRPKRRSQPPSSYIPVRSSTSNVSQHSRQRSKSDPDRHPVGFNASDENMVIFSGTHDKNAKPAMNDMHVAVIDATDVGQTSLVNEVFDLPIDEVQMRKPNIYTLQDTQYAVRFSKVLLKDIKYTAKCQISWPFAYTSSMVQAAIVIYEVNKVDGLSILPNVLDALRRSSLPVVLVPSRSVQFASVRTSERDSVEEQARALCNGVNVFHVSDSHTELQKRCVSTLLLKKAPGTKPTLKPLMIRGVELPQQEIKALSLSSSRRRADSKLSLHSQTHPGLHPSQSGSNSSSNSSSPIRYSNSSALHLDGDTELSSTTTSPTHYPGTTLDELVCGLFLGMGSDFETIFLAVYRMFVAPSELLQFMWAQCRLQINQEDYNAGSFAQEHCLMIIVQWISQYPGDFAHPLSNSCLRQILDEMPSSREASSSAVKIAAALDAVQADSDTEWAHSDSKLASDTGLLTTQRSSPPIPNKLSVVDSTLLPNPKRSVNDSQWRIFMVQEEGRIAQELVSISHKLFTSLPLRDLLRHATPSLARSHKSATFTLSILTTHFNHVAHWVSNILLIPTKPKARSLVLEKMMRISRKVRQLNDYNTLGALLAGIQATSVHRLRQTWDLVSPEQRKDFQRLEILMSNARGSASYRLAWENTRPENGCVPFLAVHQRDLVVAIAGGRTFIENKLTNDDPQTQAGATEAETMTENANSLPSSANTSFAESGISTPSTANTSFTSNSSTLGAPPSTFTPVPKGRLINWRKFEVIGATLLSLKAAQGSSYPHLQRSEAIRALVLDSVIENDEEELYRRSCVLEPVDGGTGQVMGGMRAWVGRLQKGQW